MDERVAQGRNFPLGATLCDSGANFSVFSKHSTVVGGDALTRFLRRLRRLVRLKTARSCDR